MERRRRFRFVAPSSWCARVSARFWATCPLNLFFLSSLSSLRLLALEIYEHFTWHPFLFGSAKGDSWSWAFFTSLILYLWRSLYISNRVWFAGCALFVAAWANRVCLSSSAGVLFSESISQCFLGGHGSGITHNRLRFSSRVRARLGALKLACDTQACPFLV